ncbi:dynamin family protein [Halomonas janggokensis]|uniref:Dynamin family protein n=1 Tax=Vreelandella janggokensis TaxID=370767 RepID=A0ABT4IZV6_9GAMM|nr:LeoA/HP0731 family dynamin-like GTPase [Halomonas janggokensis]MCZ0928703.1 dynamin family protein [Halomonas janggokensis]MCZ0931438.1 dynamin family protein [Halomonas janggokensis]
MDQLKQFENQKQYTLKILGDLRGVLEELRDIGMEVESDLTKIDSSVASVKDDVLRIALLGAFSDGKTSVVASWLGKVMEDMNIDMDESSDKLAVYTPEGLPEKCEIVDTPGLFGDKQKEVNGDQVMYEDVTRQYISEAHLILYVVDATNPLKDSHNDIVKWVLRDLNKLDSTVFIINKMDEVTDLTDQVLFDEQARIKTENLQEKLKRAISLSDDELGRLRIVCMASNPNGRGLPFWFSKPDIYRTRSRIEGLKAATGEILDSNLRDSMVAKTGLDVVSDLVAQRVHAADAQLAELDVFASQREQESGRIHNDIQQGQREVKRLGGELFRELQSMESQLMGKLRPLSLEDLRPFLEDEIGYSQESGVGYKLGVRIKTAVDSYCDQTTQITARLSRDINRQWDSSESFLNSISGGALKMGGKAIGQLSKVDPLTIKNTIFAARDVLGKMTGYVYKFKPWGAAKLAGNISKWAGPAGAAFTFTSDLYGAYKEHELEQELQKTKDDIGELIKSAFKDIYDVIADDEKLLNFFAPQLKEFERLMTDLDEQASEIRRNQEKIGQVQSKLRTLPLSGEAA